MCGGPLPGFTAISSVGEEYQLVDDGEIQDTGLT